MNSCKNIRLRCLFYLKKILHNQLLIIMNMLASVNEVLNNDITFELNISTTIVFIHSVFQRFIAYSSFAKVSSTKILQLLILNY